MDDMVARVVEVLDEGSVYLLPGRVLRSRVPKKKQPQHKLVKRANERKKKCRRMNTKNNSWDWVKLAMGSWVGGWGPKT